MEPFEIRSQILHYLYKKSQSDNDITDMEELMAKLNLDKNTILQQILRLGEGGFLTEGMGCTCSITPKGKDFVEGPNPFNPGWLQQQVEVCDSPGAIIMTGNHVSAANQTTAVHQDKALQQLLELLQATDSPPQQKQKLSACIEGIVKEQGIPALGRLVERLLSSWFGL